MQFPYNKDKIKGKAFMRMKHGIYYVYTYEGENELGFDEEKEVKLCYNKTEAVRLMSELNDWQDIYNVPIYRPKEHNNAFAKAYQVQPWEHVLVDKEHHKLFFFIWDTRELTKVANYPQADPMPYLKLAEDNGQPIRKDGKWLYRSELFNQKVNCKTAREQKYGKENFAFTGKLAKNLLVGSRMLSAGLELMFSNGVAKVLGVAIDYSKLPEGALEDDDAGDSFAYVNADNSSMADDVTSISDPQASFTTRKVWLVEDDKHNQYEVMYKDGSCNAYNVDDDVVYSADTLDELLNKYKLSLVND